MTRPLDADQLENLLEDILWAEASSKRSSAESLARLDRPQQEFVLHWVRALETLRLDARIARELPGIHRDMLHLNAITGRHASAPEWESWRERLSRPGSRVEDSLAAVATLMAAPPPLPAPLCYQGKLHPELVEQVMRARLEEEKAGLRSVLVRYKNELEAERPASERREASDKEPSPFSARKKQGADDPDDFEMEKLPYKVSEIYRRLTL